MENCKAIDVQRLIVDKTYRAPVPCEIIPVLDLSIVVNFKNFSRFVEVQKDFHMLWCKFSGCANKRRWNSIRFRLIPCWR